MNSKTSLNYDFDLFFDVNIFKIHTATAGGYIPSRIFENPTHSIFREKLKSVSNKLFFDYKLNPNLEEILTLKFEAQGITSNNFDRDAYLFDFIEYARRGVFSFDRTFISEPFNRKYHLVAYPFINENYNQFIQENFKFNFTLNEPFELSNWVNDIVNYRLNKPVNFPFFYYK